MDEESVVKNPVRRSRKNLWLTGVLLLLTGGGVVGYNFIQEQLNKVEILKKVIGRPEADSRVAEILVTGVNYHEEDGKTYTTIKFLEYDAAGKPMEPRYFEFSGNIIQFQSLVIRFDDIHIRNGDLLKGKSAYLFLKVFMLNGKETQEYEITKFHAVPSGYKVEGLDNEYEAELWREFWDHALNPAVRENEGIKNAQIEAPGTMFVPGVLYTIRIEHDGGLRIDAKPLSPILSGERLPVHPVSQRRIPQP